MVSKQDVYKVITDYYAQEHKIGKYAKKSDLEDYHAKLVLSKKDKLLIDILIGAKSMFDYKIKVVNNGR